MGYVAVKGGSIAIEESIKKLKYERLKKQYLYLERTDQLYLESITLKLLTRQIWLWSEGYLQVLKI